MKILVVVVLALGLPGCALFTAKNARGALDVVQTLCALENAMLGDAKVAEVCGIADVLIPDLREILAKQRAHLAAAREEGELAAKRSAAPLCPDAGR